MLKMRFVSARFMDTTEYYARAETDKSRVWYLQCISEYSVVSGLSRSMPLYRVLCICVVYRYSCSLRSDILISLGSTITLRTL